MALRWRPDDARVLLNEGRVAWLAGDCPAARAAWRKVLARDPREPAAGWWFFWSGGGVAPELAGSARASEMADYAFLVGERARSAGLEAAGWYAAALAMAPHRRAAERLAQRYREQGRASAAIAVWQDLAKRFPAVDAEHWWALGQVAELEGDWEGAARAYREGAGRSEKPYDFYMREGAAWERLERWAAAEAAYLTCSRCPAGFPLALYESGAPGTSAGGLYRGLRVVRSGEGNRSDRPEPALLPWGSLCAAGPRYGGARLVRGGPAALPRSCMEPLQPRAGARSSGGSAGGGSASSARCGAVPQPAGLLAGAAGRLAAGAGEPEGSACGVPRSAEGTPGRPRDPATRQRCSTSGNY
ncbi:MAG: tetratricopeptide repeat protein [Candidatus Methanomethyliaceae archaeon]